MEKLKKGRILLIDDDLDIRNVYQEILTENGYEVDMAVDGEEGLKKIAQDGYVLILLDIMMPKLDGLSLLRQVKEGNINAQKTPIVVLSALDQEHMIKTALARGASGFIAKVQVRPDEIIGKISAYLEKSPNS